MTSIHNNCGASAVATIREAIRQDLPEHQGADSLFKDGKWWAHCPECGATWSVFDSVTSSTGIAFDLVTAEGHKWKCLLATT